MRAQTYDAQVVSTQVRRLRACGFVDLPLPNLALRRADGRYIFRRHDAGIDVVVIRAHDAAVAARLRDPIDANPLHPHVIWWWHGEAAEVVDEFLCEFYPGDRESTRSNFSGVLDQLCPR